MKYVSLDLETTSLQPSPDHILMVSMVVEDSKTPTTPVEELPHFTCYIKHDTIKGEAYALAMNGWILDIISGRNTDLKDKDYPIYPSSYTNVHGLMKYDTWVSEAQNFLKKHFGLKKITVAGKNVAMFDMRFLPTELTDMFRHRVLDPGPMQVDWAKDDMVPNFDDCKKRANIYTPVAHDAREDAMDVIRCLRKFYT